MGHALGLNHNFKASYDKANFEFNGENTGRNYSSVMDYQASSEMNYQGPGPYDLHALRAIYTGRIELSDVAMKLIKSGRLNVEKTNEKGDKEVVRSMPVRDGMIKVEDFQKFIGFKYAADMVKKNVRDTGYLKEYAQCNDSQQGDVPACTQYDNGTSATEIVKNAIQDYHRLYNRSYVASDRLRFSWNDKVTVINSALSTFREIRGVLDDLFKMAIYETQASDEELADYLNASQMGYDFFHELIRTPDTSLGHGESEQEILGRLLVAPFQYQEVTADKDGKQVATKKTEVRIVEARPLYDQFDSPDRISTIGIGYDKAFALNFLMTANPVGGTDDRQTGWISYNEFEQYFKGVQSATQSPNMMTMLEILADQLQAGIMTPNHTLVSLGQSVTVSRMMTDNATVGVIANTNAFRSTGLDSNAEFFKVGTLKGGRKLSDRFTVTRYGQPSKSETAVRFFAPDNAFGAGALIDTAARRSVVLENKAILAKKMMEVFAGDQALKDKVNELLKTDAFKGKTGQDVVNTDETAKKMKEDNQKHADELLAQLNALNVGGILVGAEELKENPNLALDKQVLLVRSLLINTQSNLFQMVNFLQGMTLKEFREQVLPQLTDIKSKNKELATSPILALAQEIVYEATPATAVQTKDGQKVSIKGLASLMIIPKALTTPQENMMYVIEDLARYTKIFNPEYEY
jgi:hypothetical protein